MKREKIKRYRFSFRAGTSDSRNGTVIGSQDFASAPVWFETRGEGGREVNLPGLAGADAQGMKTINMKEINFTVTIDEANLILRGIGLLPFAEVYQLVAKLQQQAGQQLGREAGNGEERRPAPASVPGV